MRIISFTTTSCCRCDLLLRTYESFVKNMNGVDFKNSTLFINLDHYEGVGDVDECVRISKYFFGNVVYNVPKTPDFSSAIKWLWDREFETPYVFHLEEDWELISEINIEDIVSILNSRESLVSVRLRHRGRYTEGFSDRIVLLPSLYKKDFLKIGEFIREGKNPERCISRSSRGPRKQMIDILNVDETLSYLFSGAGIKEGKRSASIIKDIGRDWKGENGYVLGSRGIKWSKG